MAYLTISPSSKVVSAFTCLSFINILFGNVSLVFVWLALARNVEIVRINLRDHSGNHVLGLVESPHGNLGQKIYNRNVNSTRDRKREL